MVAILAKLSLEERLLAKRRITESGCWEWLGKPDNNGYGKLQHHHREKSVHVWSYEIWVGPVCGLCVLHKCDNRICFNPKHLFLGTRGQNANDMKEKGRQAKRESHSQAKLTELDISCIRIFKSLGFMNKEIAQMFAIDPSHVSRIIHFQVWR